jgi:hypothetical protein
MMLLLHVLRNDVDAAAGPRDDWNPQTAATEHATTTAFIVVLLLFSVESGEDVVDTIFNFYLLIVSFSQ